MTIQDKQRRTKARRSGSAFLTINDAGQLVVEVDDGDGSVDVKVVRAVSQVFVGLELDRVLASSKIDFPSEYTTDPKVVAMCRELRLLHSCDIEESYRDGKRVENGDPEATWDVRCVSWGWNAIQLPEHCQAQENDRNFTKFDQAEAYAVEQSKQTAHVNVDAAPIRVLPEMVECDCGHECGVAMVMSASMGTACPDCYDTLSN